MSADITLTGNKVRFVRLTQQEYAAIATKDADTLYFITDNAEHPIYRGNDRLSVYGVATQSAAGLLSAADKTKLDGLNKGVANGVAELDSNGKVPTAQLPPVDIPVDQTYDPTSTNAQSGVAVASAISEVDNIYVVTHNVTTYNELIAAIESGKYLCFHTYDDVESNLDWIDYTEEDDGIYLNYRTGTIRYEYFVSTSNVWTKTNERTILDNTSPLSASKLSGEIPSSVTAVTQSSGDNSTKVATTAYVDGAVAALPEPMIFKGSLGTGGTITTLPAASSSNEGFVYKVITAGTYDSQAADVGDIFISDGSAWILIPSGDEPSGTVTNVATGSGLTGGPITSSGTISLDTAYGDTVNPYGSKTANQVLAAPNGSNGVPSFRTLVADDLPNGNLVDGSATGSVRGINTAVEDSSYTIGWYAVAEGTATKASGWSSHAEGTGTQATGDDSHSEGFQTQAKGDGSHAEGQSTSAAGTAAHAEGSGTKADGSFGHAEGWGTTAKGPKSHSEGYNTTAKGPSSHAEGSYTIASGTNQHVRGRFNQEDTTAFKLTEDTQVKPRTVYYTYDEYGSVFTEVQNPVSSLLSTYYEWSPDESTVAEIIGNGVDFDDRSNARTLSWNGKEWLADTLEVSRDPVSNLEVATKKYVDDHSGGGDVSVYYKKDESIYTTTTSSETTIPVGITGFRSTDILMVDVEGLNLVENVDYTISGTNIVLTSPITHIGTTVHFTAMRIVEVTPQDYAALKGDKGDSAYTAGSGIKIENGVISLDLQQAESQTF